MATSPAVSVKRGAATPRTTALRGKKQKLEVLAAMVMAGCARTRALAEHLCRHAEAGNAEGVREVLAEGADIDEGFENLTPLMLACRGGHMPCVLTLLEAGADLEKCGPGTALHFATTNDREACVRALIKEGATVDAFSSRGHTPLMIACKYHYDAIVTALLDANADPHIIDDVGNNLANYACNSDDQQPVPQTAGAKRILALLEQPRVPVPWSREGHADFPKPRREQAVALVRAGATLCLATCNPSAFRNAWNEFMMETYLPAEIQPMAAQVRLRFAVEDAPNLCVATTPFRLVARKDPALLEQS